MNIKGKFYKCIQETQGLSGDSEHMFSRIYFTLVVGDKIYDLYSILKQAVGSNFEAANIEVGYPEGYKGPFNYDVFYKLAQKYYISSFGPQGSAINTTSAIMINNIAEKDMNFEFEVNENVAAW